MVDLGSSLNILDKSVKRLRLQLDTRGSFPISIRGHKVIRSEGDVPKATLLIGNVFIGV
jgi:hypothetical protein